MDREYIMNPTLVELAEYLQKHQDILDTSIEDIANYSEKAVEHAYKSACIEHASMSHTEANQAWLTYKATL